MASVRHDWYQTDQKVVIDVLVKNATNRNCSVDIQSDRLVIRGDDLELDLALAHQIDTTKSSFRILSVKIEISLQKFVGDRWTSLVKKEDVVPAASFTPYPPSKSSTPSKSLSKNWDRVVKDAWDTEGIEKDESKQLNNLFEKIYQDSTPEVRRAMNKSFTESGGTVLSTNWKEVGAQKVDVKPPSGTEFKQWEPK